ncbi:MAG: hypothetical protein QNJ46_16255 [Leptolyngbyaceae cyanobacterium MO_188.B28]|nr:hypothetical protein [Leptolyngbyaceae cyanobacterium MO_188.B28]
MKDKILNGLNLFLMVDLFLVLSSFVWFAVAVAGRAAHLNLGFDLWYSLWQPLFLPAISILMAGAIVSGVASWISKKFSSAGN